MKTNLNITITNEEEATAFLFSLWENNELFNPDDNAHGVLWQTCSPTDEEKDKLNELMAQVWQVETEDGSFDPHDYLIELDEEEERINKLSRPTEY